MISRLCAGLVLLVMYGISSSRISAQQTGPDFIRLFRDEATQASQKLKWRGPELDDETRFAAAASGLTWNPTVNENSLIISAKKGMHYASVETRIKAFQSARSPEENREKFAAALSLVITPQESGDSVVNAALTYLSRFPEAFDKSILGIIESPENFPLLNNYQYAATDLLVHRASMRLFPVFLTLAKSRDAYLRSRGITALGLLCYRNAAGKPDDFIIRTELKEYGISAVQRRLVFDVLVLASEDKAMRVRIAAAFALGLIGDSDALEQLQELAKDPAFIVTAAPDKNTKSIVFPVRREAALALRRIGRSVEDGSGTFRGKELSKALKGCREISQDNKDIKPGLPGGIPINNRGW